MSFIRIELPQRLSLSKDTASGPFGRALEILYARTKVGDPVIRPLTSVALLVRSAAADDAPLMERISCLAEALSQLGIWPASVEVMDRSGEPGLGPNRVRFDELLAEIQAGRIGCVVVRDRDRIGRNHSDFDQFANVLRSAGATLIVAQPSPAVVPLHPNTAEAAGGDIYASAKALADGYEVFSRRTRGRRPRASRGRHAPRTSE